MNRVEMCAYCGTRPVRPAKRRSAEGPGGRTKYCAVCFPTVQRELHILASHRWHDRRRQAYVIDPVSGEAIRGQTAYLTNVGEDYLALKQAGQIRRAAEPEHHKGKALPKEKA